MKRPYSAPGRGFTLVELLVTAAIVSVLLTIGYLALQLAITHGREKDTIAFIGNVHRAIEEYKEDHSNYPRPAAAEETAVVKDETYVVGGAQMLYQVLSGDGTNAILEGEEISTGAQGSAQDGKNPLKGKVYLNTVVAPTRKMLEARKEAKYVEAGEGGTYFVVDAWRRPLRYQLLNRNRQGIVQNDPEIHSGNAFEIWSYGRLSKAAEDGESRKKWLTNWGK